MLAHDSPFGAPVSVAIASAAAGAIRTRPWASTSTSLILRKRVTRRGEPGGREKPSCLSAFSRTSTFTQRPGSLCVSRRMTVMIWSRLAPCGSSTGAAGRGGVGCDGAGRAGAGRRCGVVLAGAAACGAGPVSPCRRPWRRPPRVRRGRLGSAAGSAATVPRWCCRRRKTTPRAAATSPTASKARSLEIISSTSPAVACPSQQPAATAIHRSLQSRTPRAGALCTS